MGAALTCMQAAPNQASNAPNPYYAPPLIIKGSRTDSKPGDWSEQAPPTTTAMVDSTIGVPDCAKGVTLMIKEGAMAVCRSSRTPVFEKVSELGKGGFGIVWLCRTTTATDRGTPRMFALKELWSPDNFVVGRGRIQDHLPLDEAALQRYMVHGNIVHYYWSEIRMLDAVTLKPLDASLTSLVDAASWTSVDALAQTATSIIASQSLDGCQTEEIKLEMRICMEHCDLGSLADYLAQRPKHRGRPLSEGICHKKCGLDVKPAFCAILTALDIVNGLRYMHCNCILHADLKPQNILLVTDRKDTDKGFRAKLSDFGLSSHMRRGEQQNVPITNGTIAYLPRDAFEARAASKATDMYAIGLILWEVWYARTWSGIYAAEKIRRGARRHADMYDYQPACGPECPKAYADLVHACLANNPSRRPSARSVGRALQILANEYKPNRDRVAREE